MSADYLRPHAAHCGSDREVISMLQEGEPAEVRVRCNPALRRKIRDAAEEAARSMSAEAAYRLEKSFERDEAMRGTSPA